VLSNHFHVLVKVPEQGELSDAELLRRYKVLYPEPNKWNTAQFEVMEALFAANGPEAAQLRTKLLARMGDVSQFMKTFKQRFSIWFNRNHERFGPLWAERFTSTIVEGGRHFGLQMVAAYIDLNPVRAGLAKDPKDYRWCGYGEAEASGGTAMVEGLRMALGAGAEGVKGAVSAQGAADTEDAAGTKGSEGVEGKALDTGAKVLANYRMLLFGKGVSAKRGDPDAARISTEELARVQREGGRLTGAQRLRLRVSWFTKGAVIGGELFVQEHLAQYRERTRKRTRLEPRTFVKGADAKDGWRGLFSMRNGA
jgi:hypothetical protein